MKRIKRTKRKAAKVGCSGGTLASRFKANVYTDWPYKCFTKKEMACPCGCGGLPVKKFMDKLEATRNEAGFPFIVTSGYRCPEYNAQVASSGDDGAHTIGAADISARGGKALMIVSLGLKHGMTGIGVAQRGNSRFIHLDDLVADDEHPRPWIWSY